MKRLRSAFHRYSEMLGDVIWSALGDGLSLVANIVSFLLLYNELAGEVYGGYVGFYGILAPIGALSWSGLTLLVLQRIIKEADDAQSVTNRALAMTLCQGVVGVGLVVLISSRVISTISTSTMLLMAVAELVIFPISHICVALVQATHGFATSAKIRLAIPLVRVFALLAVYAFADMTIRNLAFAWIFGFSVTGLVSLLVVLPRYGLTAGFGRPDRRYVRMSLELSTPMAASNLQTHGDKAVMNYFNQSAEAGVYGAAFRIVMLAQFPIMTMERALFQRFLPSGDGRKGVHLNRAIRFAGASLALSVVIALGMFILAPIVLPWFPGEELDSTIVRWLVPFIPLLAISQPPLNGLMGLGLTTTRAYLIVSSAALSMILYVTLIPSHSWKGAAIGTIVAELYLAIASWTTLIRAQRRDDNLEPHPLAEVESSNPADEPLISIVY